MSQPPQKQFDGVISNDLLKQLAYNEKMAELGRISAGMVHEVNAPLSVIISAAQMILREDDIPDFVREMVGRISSEAQRLSQMTRGLLNFSSHDEGTHEADVNLTAEFVLEFVGYEAARRGVVLLRNLDHRLPAVGRVELPARMPAHVERALGAVEVAADVLALLGVVGGEEALAGLVDGRRLDHQAVLQVSNIFRQRGSEKAWA